MWQLVRPAAITVVVIRQAEGWQKQPPLERCSSLPLWTWGLAARQTPMAETASGEMYLCSGVKITIYMRQQHSAYVSIWAKGFQEGTCPCQSSL